MIREHIPVQVQVHTCPVAMTGNWPAYQLNKTCPKPEKRIEKGVECGTVRMDENGPRRLHDFGSLRFSSCEDRGHLLHIYLYGTTLALINCHGCR